MPLVIGNDSNVSSQQGFRTDIHLSKCTSSQISNIRCPFEKKEVKSSITEDEMSNDIGLYYTSHCIILMNCRCVNFLEVL